MTPKFLRTPYSNHYFVGQSLYLFEMSFTICGCGMPYEAKCTSTGTELCGDCYVSHIGGGCSCSISCYLFEGNLITTPTLPSFGSLQDCPNEYLVRLHNYLERQFPKPSPSGISLADVNAEFIRRGK